MATIPTFYLYGEPHRSIEDGFVHVESLDDRSRPSEWTIRPHAHAELAHIFYLAEGGGEMHAGGKRLPCPAPCLLLVPAAIVHSFEWEAETVGSVITLATRRLAGLSWLAPDTSGILADPDVVTLSASEAETVERCVAELLRELSWAKIGHDAAVQSALLAIIVLALRGRLKKADRAAESRQRTLVARLRERIEERFRLRETVSDYAAALGASETTLRLACATIAGRSPAAMLDQRALLEAQRNLLFSDLTISEVAYSVGFDDPAYFSRFFAKAVGLPPREYRKAQRNIRAIDLNVDPAS